jgi:hypothetical protein
MSDKLKGRARALSKKLNISYQAAHNQLQAANNQAVAPLLAQLHAESAFVVSVSRASPSGSANLAIAEANAARMAASPMIVAESGSASMAVTPQQGHALIKCGAADAREVQMIRSFHNEHQMTFSERCNRCQRWIWCGETEVEESCFCGQRYRVVFDLAPMHRWTMDQNRRCMDCGIDAIPHPVGSGTSPWHLVNAGQSRCNLCHTKEAARQKAREVPDRIEALEDNLPSTMRSEQPDESGHVAHPKLCAFCIKPATRRLRGADGHEGFSCADHIEDSTRLVQLRVKQSPRMAHAMVWEYQEVTQEVL